MLTPRVKNIPPIASTRREQSVVFFSRSATTLSFETPGGRIHPPPLPGRVMENALPGRGLKETVHLRKLRCFKKF